jgi:YesN/AraC family two-component response regulator
MLERGGMPIQQVSSAVGYEDVAFFRGLFKRATGMTPAEYRAEFAPLQVRGHAVVA